ncbi:Tim44 domain-containing protein [Trichlorobacter ammonificans]|uniref:Import inner membrane translocase, subunit Tim44 n=1 Tax=Trichlorobacter ammonificans TaxID=2916410 RepID=A0ABM9D5Q4_9BACT|nr:Tim44 domain-containing protein [Trichlorobacter ammonificans]CAH2030533.1 Import inner membrane translocase, subunit Tim44 [Trichlorobacter ammonificans]
MKRHVGRLFTVMATVLLLSGTVLELTAHAKAGGSRSMGSRGSRSVSKPASPAYQQNQQRQQQAAPTPGPMQQQAGGGFLRSMAGGIMGGLLGSMLFSSFAGAAGGMGGGGGIGLLEILLLAGVGYAIYRFIAARKRAEHSPAARFQGNNSSAPLFSVPSPAVAETVSDQVSPGLAHVRQMDRSFDESAFCDTVMDHFFRIQAAWMHRDLTPVAGLLTDEMRQILQEDVDRLLRENLVNRLENIAVKKVEITEVWQESGQDYITTLIHASLLDYTTDAGGALRSGSMTEPISFREYWTVTRPVGNNPWRLSAIHQHDPS